MKLLDNTSLGLFPVIVQDELSRQVLMLGFMNQEALELTRSTGKVTFFSRSRQQIWTKGETSGNFLLVKKVLEDCDNDTLLILAQPTGPTCHTGTRSCFGNEESPRFIHQLERVIQQRKSDDPEDSYTARLFARGTPKIAQKVGEEAVEVVIEAMANNREKLLEEGADLIYHLLVLLADQGCSFEEIEKVLHKRHQTG